MHTEPCSRKLTAGSTQPSAQPGAGAAAGLRLKKESLETLHLVAVGKDKHKVTFNPQFLYSKPR